MSQLKFLQLNCHKSKAVTSNLNNALLRDVSVALLQEPHTYKDEIVGLGSYNVMHGASLGTRPRAAIVTPRHINAWFEKEFSDQDIAVAVVKDGHREAYIVSLYLDILRPVQDLSLIHI